MQKLLIAERSDAYTGSLEKSLQAEWEVHVCTDSYPVIDTMKYINPDAMIINLNLAPKDGITVLQEAYPELPPVVLALSNFISPYILQTAESLGVGCVMRIPCKTDYIADRIKDMYQAYIEKPNAISRYLHIFGINTHLSGYRCLQAIIPLFASDPQQLLKEVYPTVAKLCGLNDARCVERVIRTAIHDAWRRRDISVWKKYFPEDTCPSNKLFVTRIAEMI